MFAPSAGVCTMFIIIIIVIIILVCVCAWCIRVCVRACVSACARECACVCVRACVCACVSGCSQTQLTFEGHKGGDSSLQRSSLLTFSLYCLLDECTECMRLEMCPMNMAYSEAPTSMLMMVIHTSVVFWGGQRPNPIHNMWEIALNRAQEYCLPTPASYTVQQGGRCAC